MTNKTKHCGRFASWNSRAFTPAAHLTGFYFYLLNPPWCDPQSASHTLTEGRIKQSINYRALTAGPGFPTGPGGPRKPGSPWCTEKTAEETVSVLSQKLCSHIHCQILSQHKLSSVFIFNRTMTVPFPLWSPGVHACLRSPGYPGGKRDSRWKNLIHYQLIPQAHQSLDNIC